MTVDGLPTLESNLRRFRFLIKELIAEELKNSTDEFLIPKIQEALIEGDYIYKADYGEKPNLLDSIYSVVKTRSRAIDVEVQSSTNYARFFEEGRQPGDFPSGEAYEYQNLVGWLIRKKKVSPGRAPGIAAYMMDVLRDNPETFRFPDPVIVPTAEEYEEEFTQDLARRVNASVGELFRA